MATIEINIEQEETEKDVNKDENNSKNQDVYIFYEDDEINEEELEYQEEMRKHNATTEYDPNLNRDISTTELPKLPIEEGKKLKIEVQVKTKKTFKWRVQRYFTKMKGDPKKRPKRSPLLEWFWSWVASMIGISLVGVIHYNILIKYNLEFIVGSFGASAVLIYGAPTSPLAQPRNFLGGHLVSAIVGITVKWIFQGQLMGVACGVGVATSILVMHITSTLHPPGGATALIAIMSPFLPWAGYQYVFIPILSGCLVMLLVALLINNLSRYRSYPEFWF